MNFFYKILLLIFLSFILVIFLLPPPWQKQNLFVNKFLIPDKKVKFQAIWPHFNPAINILFSSVNIPSNIEYYNIHIENLNNKYDYTYSLTIDENDPILPYLENKIGYSSKEFGIDGHPAFLIKPGDHFFVNQIPIQIPLIDNFGTAAICNSGQINNNGQVARCPNGDEKYFPETLRVYATPNLYSWVTVCILIIVFWVVVINNFYDFFIKKYH